MHEESMKLLIQSTKTPECYISIGVRCMVHQYSMCKALGGPTLPSIRPGLPEMAFKVPVVLEARAPTSSTPQNFSQLCCGHGAHSAWHTPAFFLFSPNSSSSFKIQAWGSSAFASDPNLHLDKVPCLCVPKGSWVSLHLSRNIFTYFLYQTEFLILFASIKLEPKKAQCLANAE